MKTKTIIAVCLLTIGIIFLSCKKETGPVGPQGAQGPAGTNGNANVIVDQYTVNAVSWQIGCSGSCWNYSFNMTGKDLTTGAVMVYANTGTEWIAMPFTASDVEFYFSTSTNAVTFYVRSASGGTSVSNPGTIAFKIVFIPELMIRPDINLKDFSQVQKAYNIQ